MVLLFRPRIRSASSRALGVRANRCSHADLCLSNSTPLHNIRRQVCYRILPAGKTKEDSHNTHVLRCLLYFATGSTNVLSGVCYSICMSLNIPFFIEYSFASYLSAIAACVALNKRYSNRRGKRPPFILKGISI